VFKDWVALRSIWPALAAGDAAGNRTFKPSMTIAIGTNWTFIVALLEVSGVGFQVSGFRCQENLPILTPEH
jgi:hypothetical protein